MQKKAHGSLFDTAQLTTVKIIAFERIPGGRIAKSQVYYDRESACQECELAGLRQVVREEASRVEDPLNILLIEDNPVLVKLIAEELRRELGCWTYLECASKLSIAYESLADGEFDAILADLSITNGSGSSFISILRSFAPETPLFALLDDGHEVLGMEAVRMGANGCLFKHELNDRAWLARVCKSIERRRAALQAADN
ncbi:MAG: response regulator [Candidatus Acidiferrales bacterium]